MGSNNNNGSSSSSRRGGWWMVVFAVVSALCVCGPALYFKFHSNIEPEGVCPPCSSSSSCLCPPPPHLLQIAPGSGLANLSATSVDCGATDPQLKKEMEKQSVDLLTEELKLQQGVAAEHALHMNLTLTDARRLAFLYQREADKCVAATETCESARERFESFLARETKLTSIWERRARNLGWQ